VVTDLFDDPARVLAVLRWRATAARQAGNLAQATAVGGMIDAVEQALWRQRWLDALRRVDRLVLGTARGEGAEVVRGRLVRSWAGDDQPAVSADGAKGDLGRLVFGPAADGPNPDVPLPDGPLTPAAADELACVAHWIEDNMHQLAVLRVEGELSVALPRPAADVARRPVPAGLRCAAC
jgi:hypothetical protein